MRIRKLLIANRGEIAVRIMRTCRELGIASVAVYSDADRDALHVREADEAYRIGPAPAAESYLNIPAILAAAQRRAAPTPSTPATASCPSARRSPQAVLEAGLIWVGPPPEAIRALGDKIAAKRIWHARRRAHRARLLRRRARRPTPRRCWPRGRAHRLSGADQGGGGRRRQGHARGRARGRVRARRWRARTARRRRPSATRRVFLEKYMLAPAPRRDPDHRRHARAPCCTWASANARSSAATRRCWRKRPRPRPQLDAARRAAMGAGGGAGGRRRPATPTPARSSLSSTPDGQLLLPRNEHAPAGGAPRHRDDHLGPHAAGRPPRPGPGGAAIARGQGEPLPFTPGGGRARAGTPFEARVYAEDPAKGFLPSIGRIALLRAAGGPGRPQRRRRGRRATRSASTTTRCWPS